MKKEIFAVVLLAAILVLSLVNINKFDGITAEIVKNADEARSRAENGDWEGSVSYARGALDVWLSNETYTHVFLRHEDISTITDDLYELYECATSQEDDIAAASELVKVHILTIGKMEKICVGSIF